MAMQTCICFLFSLLPWFIWRTRSLPSSSTSDFMLKSVFCFCFSFCFPTEELGLLPLHPRNQSFVFVFLPVYLPVNSGYMGERWRYFDSNWKLCQEKLFFHRFEMTGKTGWQSDLVDCTVDMVDIVPSDGLVICLSCCAVISHQQDFQVVPGCIGVFEGETGFQTEKTCFWGSIRFNLKLPLYRN